MARSQCKVRNRCNGALMRRIRSVTLSTYCTASTQTSSSSRSRDSLSIALWDDWIFLYRVIDRPVNRGTLTWDGETGHDNLFVMAHASQIQSVCDLCLRR